MPQKPPVEYYAARRKEQQAPCPTVPAGSDPWALLVAHMADGDQRAAKALFAAWYPELFRVADMIVRNRADAEEVVNDTFGQAWRNSATFDVARGSSAAWLTTMARSRARDLVRARARRDRAREKAEQLAAVEGGVHGSGWPMEHHEVIAVEARELETLLSRALQQLPRKQREALELVFLGGASHTTAADRLGAPLGTVKTRVRLGLRRLRVVLSEAGVQDASY